MTILSPNAQAILDAVKHYETNHWCHVSHVAATVLLVIAEQIQPGRNPLDDSDAAAGVHAAEESMYNYLLALAEELEEQSSTTEQSPAQE
jgi:hypothetical protein